MQPRQGKSIRNNGCDPDMKNLYEVLRQKELEVQQLQKEIEALRLAARLLADDNETESSSSSTRSVTQVPTPRVSAAAAVAAAVKPAEPLNASAAGIRQFP